MRKRARTHSDLEVYGKAFAVAMQVFELTKGFPKTETYSLIDQVRRSSRSVCANIAEAWRKRRYSAALIAKLSDAETEAAETQVWIEFAVSCGYLERSPAQAIYQAYNEILGTLVGMINYPETWVLTRAKQVKLSG